MIQAKKYTSTSGTVTVSGGFGSKTPRVTNKGLRALLRPLNLAPAYPPSEDDPEEPSELEPTPGELFIYREIDQLCGVDPEQLANSLAQMGDISELNIYINSPGGNVFDSFAIYQILNRHPATKNVFIDGVAASGASVIAMVGDNIEMAESAKMMIHNASTLTWGESDEHRRTADLLDQFSETIANIYAARSGQATTTIQKWMDAETWFSAAEAVDNGLADTIAQLKGKIGTDASAVARRMQQLEAHGRQLQATRTTPAAVSARLAELGRHSRTY